jgi:phosphoglycolate phosphatase-like HAD superfamily hydrolase/ADP-ribose pyrophosphatase YjhB (NUDIX family)
VIRNVILDWSGTLVDDLPAVLKATNHVLRLAGRPAMTLEQFRSEFCLPFTKFYDRHAPHVPLPRLEEWFHGCFKNVQDSVVELPHAREFLKFCRARGLRMFVLSTVRPDHFKIQSSRVRFAAYLESAYLGVRDKRLKIRQVLRQNKLKLGETLFIGDMQHDIDAAKAGGVHSCAVLTGYNGAAQLRARAPDLIVEHLGELREIMERNGLELHPPKLETGDAQGAPVVTVGALVFNIAGQVLMIRTHKWSGLWGIAGGKVKWGETSADALRREIKEETDLDIRDIRFELVQDCIHSKEFYHDAHFVLLNYTCRCGGRPVVKLNDEAREFRWASPEQALKLALNKPTRILLRAVLKNGGGARTPATKGKRRKPATRHNG